MTKQSPFKTVPGRPQRGSVVSLDAELDDRLDAALDQTFPCSDPVSLTSRPRPLPFTPADSGA